MLDIVVVNYNTRRLLERCLRSIRAETPPGACTLYVVDNASTDGSRAWLRAQPDVVSVRNRTNQGYARACNQGARLGTGDLILFLNADVAVLPGWLPPLRETMAADERIAVVGPRLINEGGRIVGAGVVGTNARPHVRLWMRAEAEVKDDRPLDCVSVCGAAYLIRRSLVPVLGLFDERYPLYFEETDYSYNARDKGYRVVYCPRSRMIHTWGGSGRGDPRLAQWFATGRALFHRRWAHMMADPHVYG